MGTDWHPIQVVQLIFFKYSRGQRNNTHYHIFLIKYDQSILYFI